MNKSFRADEEWRELYIPNILITGNYQISNYGQVRRYKPDDDAFVLLKPSTVNGYFYLSFRSEKNWKERKTFSIHRLVASNFLIRNAEKKFVLHEDFNKKNNHVSNLRWCTQKELTEHNKQNPKVKNAVKHGMVTNSKLTETEVIRLKKKLSRGKNKLYKLAKEFGITHTQLNRIRRGDNWGHIQVN